MYKNINIKIHFNIIYLYIKNVNCKMIFVLKNKKINILVKRFIFGILIGASMMIPGLSGGTTAIILGVFYEIMNAVENFFVDIRKSVSYLLPYLVGGIIGFAFICYPLKFLLSEYNLYFVSVIIGLVIGSVKIFFKNKKINLKSIIFIMIGFSFVLIQYSLLYFNFHISENYLFVILIGMVSAIALILPGISFTNILVSFGCYDDFINNIVKFDFIFLIVFTTSVLAGIILFTKFILMFYKKYPDNTDLILSGLILGSIIQLLKDISINIKIMPCVLLIIGGGCISLILTQFDK